MISWVADQHDAAAQRQAVECRRQFRLGRGVVDHDHSRATWPARERGVDAGKAVRDAAIDRDHDIHRRWPDAGGNRAAGRMASRCRQRIPPCRPRMERAARQVAAIRPQDRHRPGESGQIGGRDDKTARARQRRLALDPRHGRRCGHLPYRPTSALGRTQGEYGIPSRIARMPGPAGDPALGNGDAAFNGADRRDINRTAQQMAVLPGHRKLPRQFPSAR